MIPYLLSKRIIFGLLILGILIDGYLTITHIQGGPITCSATHGCDIIRMSEYSRIKGIPIAIFGLGMYLLLAIISLSEKRFMTTLMIVISGIGLAISAYLVYLQLAVIRAICTWCMASAVLISLIFFCFLLTKKPKG